MKNIAIYVREQDARRPMASERLYTQEAVCVHALKSLGLLKESGGEFTLKVRRSFRRPAYRRAFADREQSVAYAFMQPYSALGELLELIVTDQVHAVMVDQVERLFGGPNIIVRNLKEILIKHDVRLFTVFGEFEYRFPESSERRL